MTNQTLSEDIEKLISVITNSTQNFQNLIKVKGKVDMLIGCTEEQQQTDIDTTYTLKKQKPLILLEEEEEEFNQFQQDNKDESTMEENMIQIEENNEISDSVSDSEEEKLDQELDQAYENMVLEDTNDGIKSDSLDEFIGIDQEAD